jgi:DNA helicase-2/ATP-dependent DNA helicase PcrA
VLDEAQDFSDQQWALVESWLPYVDQLVLAGDDDQAIYKWSGANPHGMN